MISNTAYSNGTNNFKDFTFSANEWSAPGMVSPAEIRTLLDSFLLCGRKISRMRLIGHSYFHTRDWVEDAAYRQLEGLPEEERQRRSNYLSIDSEMQFLRFAEIDEPLLIEFEDGDVFEIEALQEPEFCMSMNCIPWWINAGTNQPNADAEMLFSPCIAQTIKAVEVNTYKTSTDPMFRIPFDEAPYERELVSDITLRFENGAGLRIGAQVDYCVIECVDDRNEVEEISFSELRQALFNWEDLHHDEATGFEAESHTLFFGPRGRNHTETPYMKIVSAENANSALYISAEDCLLLGWCITHAKGEYFDEYYDYHFTSVEWQYILDEALRLLNFETFDELFDETVGWSILNCDGENGMLNYMNSCGAEFWREREKYRTQFRDFCEWTKLVLADGSTIGIYAFRRW